jgi:hypothetical protein
MKIDATEADLRATAEVLKLAAILDDRAPAGDKARIAAWGEKIHQHRLERNDLLDGLQAFYDSPSERAIQIGDLIHHARIVRRDRNEREADAERERRAGQHDIKAEDEIRGIAAGIVMGPTPTRTPRLEAAELALHCCSDKREAQAAIREYFAAKSEAKKTQAPA